MNLPKCPKYSSEYVYEDGNVLNDSNTISVITDLKNEGYESVVKLDILYANKRAFKKDYRCKDNVSVLLLVTV